MHVAARTDLLLVLQLKGGMSWILGSGSTDPFASQGQTGLAMEKLFAP